MRVVMMAMLAGSITLAAQQSDRQSFRTRTDLIRVDVSVLDRNRRPVHGLTAADFTVTEDGKPQSVDAFAEITLPDPETFPVAWMRDIAPDVRHNDDVTDYRLVVLIMDDAALPSVPHMVQSAKVIGRDVIANLGPRDLLAVVFTRDNRHAQNFTQDRARLLAAVESFHDTGHDPRAIFGQGNYGEKQRFLDAIGVLERAVAYLAPIPDRRKAIISVSAGIPINPEELVRGSPGDPMVEVYAKLKELVRVAERGSVNVYAVDPGGLDGIWSIYQQDLSQSRYPAAMEATRERYQNAATLYREFLMTVADNTGGRAFVNSNDVSGRAAQIFRETGSFYLLGYRTANTKADGKLRRIQVRVNRRDVTVNARKGYYGADLNPAMTGAPPPATVAAIAGLLPKSDLPLDVVAAPFAVPGQNDATVAIALGLRAPDLHLGADTVNLLLNAYSVEGDLRASDRLRAQVDLTSAGGSYEVFAKLALKPGRYELRLSAESTASQKSGSVYYDVDVPDFEKAPLSLSGLVLSVTPSPPASPRDLFAALMPVVPTTRRTFARSDSVTGFVRLYEGGGNPLVPATVIVRITDAKGVVVLERPRTIAVEELAASRSADHQFAVSLADLAPGPYLLTVEATAGSATARRDARFEVK